MAQYQIADDSWTKTFDHAGGGVEVNVSVTGGSWGTSGGLYVQQYNGVAWYPHPAGTNYHTADFSYTFTTGSYRGTRIYGYNISATTTLNVDVQPIPLR